MICPKYTYLQNKEKWKYSNRVRQPHQRLYTLWNRNIGFKITSVRCNIYLLAFSRAVETLFYHIWMVWKIKSHTGPNLVNIVVDLDFHHNWDCVLRILCFKSVTKAKWYLFLVTELTKKCFKLKYNFWILLCKGTPNDSGWDVGKITFPRTGRRTLLTEILFIPGCFSEQFFLSFHGNRPGGETANSPNVKSNK